MNAANRFTQGIEDFARLLGPKTAAVLLTQAWREAAATLKLDPKGEIARALASQHTWSGIVLDWPVDGTERAAADRNVRPAGVRPRPPDSPAFAASAICRDMDRLAALERARAPTAMPARRRRPRSARSSTAPSRSLRANWATG